MHHSLSNIIFGVMLVTLLIVTVAGQESEYQTVVVNYRELRLVPEDFSVLTNTYSIFNTRPELNKLLEMNDTHFWEALGGINSDFSENSSLSTFAIVQINESGFYETLVGLSLNNLSLEWIAQLNNSIAANFSTVVHAATEFFANDSIYWGLCEELSVIPGSLVEAEESSLWRFVFHLIAESERWTLLIDTSGNLIDAEFSEIPCPTCPFSILAIILSSVVISSSVLAIFYYKLRAKGFKTSNIQD